MFILFKCSDSGKLEQYQMTLVTIHHKLYDFLIVITNLCYK